MDGLIFRGVVAGRTRKFVIYNESQSEVVTYKVIANGKEYYISHFAPAQYFEVSPDIIDIPVYVKAYVDRNGVLRTSIRVNLESSPMRGGEAF